MTPNARRLASIFGAALLLGVGGNLLLGASPAEVKPVAAPELPWQPVGMRVPDLAVADGVWEARAPWGAAPKPVEPPPPPPAPPPVPVGIVGTGNARQAIFLVSGAGELRLGVGGALPDGGSVLEVSAMKVAWTDGTGQRQERRMFSEPVDLPVSANAGLAASSAAPAPGLAPGTRPGSRPGSGPGGPMGRPGAAPAPAPASATVAPSAAPSAPPSSPRRAPSPPGAARWGGGPPGRPGPGGS